MTLGQAALKWLLAEPLVVTTLPNIYDDEQLAEFAAASDLPDLTRAQTWRASTELDAANFGVDEDPMKYKGAMTRERWSEPRSSGRAQSHRTAGRRRPTTNA